MARFNSEQLEEARKIIKDFVSEEDLNSFNAKIPLIHLESEDPMKGINNFHSNMIDLCHSLFDNISFAPTPRRIFVDDTMKPALFIIWFQKDIPDNVLYCLGTIDTKKYTVHIISDENVDAYIDVPFDIKKAHSEGKLGHAGYSDYIRVSLLEKYYGLYFDATTIFTDEIPSYCMNMPYWSIKGNYQRNTRPVAMLNYHFGQTYALGGYDNYIYSKVRQLCDHYFAVHDYLFAYYYIYYFFEYLYLTDEKIKQQMDAVSINNENCEQLAYYFGDNSIKFEKDDNTFFYKLRASDDLTEEHKSFIYQNLLKVK